MWQAKAGSSNRLEFYSEAMDAQHRRSNKHGRDRQQQAHEEELLVHPEVHPGSLNRGRASTRRSTLEQFLHAGYAGDRGIRGGSEHGGDSSTEE